ncbi:hypothetical protein EDB87DRAFT_1622940 [Lactarius vividus]|nr:hypothetical protein EDB87DRAFT_1622940 [Lactarius vividus]
MSLRLRWLRATIRNTSPYWISPTSASHLLFSLTMASSSSAHGNNSTYGLPSNGDPQTVSVDPRMTIHNTSGPGSAYYVRSSSINRTEESTCAPTARYVDVGTPNYAPAPNQKSVAFCLRSDVDPASPSRGISIPSFFVDNFDDIMEAPYDTPLASMPAGEENTIVLEFHVRRPFLIDRLSSGHVLSGTTVAWLHALFRQHHHSVPQNDERALRAPAHLALLSRESYCGARSPFRQNGTAGGTLPSDSPWHKVRAGSHHRRSVAAVPRSVDLSRGTCSVGTPLYCSVSPGQGSRPPLLPAHSLVKPVLSPLYVIRPWWLLASLFSPVEP